MPHLLDAYRLTTRARNKLFSLGAASAFAEFGRKSVIHLPITCVGEERISVGTNVMVGPDCWLETSPEGTLSLADGVRLTGRVTIAAVERIEVARDALLARGVYVSDHSHAFGDLASPIRLQGTAHVAPVRIGAGCWLGQNAVVLPGVTIGAGAVVGANSVVNIDVPDRAIAVGAPARLVGVTHKERVGRAVPSESPG